MPRYDEQTLRRFIMAIKFEELNKDGSVKRQFKGVKWIALAAAVAVLAAASLTIVPAGSTGVVLTLGKVSQNSMPRISGH